MMIFTVKLILTLCFSTYSWQFCQTSSSSSQTNDVIPEPVTLLTSAEVKSDRYSQTVSNYSRLFSAGALA